MNRQEVTALIDSYLLGQQKDRTVVFSRIAAWTPDVAAAQPIIRALAMVGARAADESLIALRLILAGKPVEDSAVAELRGISKAAVAGNGQAAARYREETADSAS